MWLNNNKKSGLKPSYIKKASDKAIFLGLYIEQFFFNFKLWAVNYFQENATS